MYCKSDCKGLGWMVKLLIRIQGRSSAKFSQSTSQPIQAYVHFKTPGECFRQCQAMLAPVVLVLLLAALCSTVC